MCSECPSPPETFTCPEGSKAHLADNPNIFTRWINETDHWPYLMLCRDENTSSYTWHMLCDTWNIKNLIKKSWAKTVIYAVISNNRKRSLTGVELIYREGTRSYSHEFLT